MRRNSYWVEYKMYEGDKVQGIAVVASNKADAWDVATYEAIPDKEGQCPYCAWVDNVTYNNGKQRFFNTFEGNPY